MSIPRKEDTTEYMLYLERRAALLEVARDMLAARLTMVELAPRMRELTEEFQKEYGEVT